MNQILISSQNLRSVIKGIILSVACTFLAFPAKAQSFSGGIGVKDNPYLISTAKDLKDLADYVNAGNTAYNTSGVFYELTNDINLSVYSPWTPIGGSYNGDNNKRFRANFDGKGHVITNVFVFQTDESAGFFGEIGNVAGKVKDLGVIGNVTGTISVGGFVGILRIDGVITNCYFIGTVTSTRAGGGYANMGGFAGLAYGKITDSYAMASVNAVNNANRIGGFVGQISEGTLKNCYVTGDVKGGERVGGLVGCIDKASTITNCAALNRIVTASIKDVGKVVGFIMNPTPPSFINDNYAYKGMLAGNVKWTTSSTSVQGIDVDKSEINAIGFFENTVFEYPIVEINADDTGLIHEGVGAISSSSARLLYDYPEPERSQILDYLFSPAYGGRMQVLKVEIGGDMNSTTLAEASHMRVEGVVDEDLGFEWWLMEEAKKRNPDIKLSALAWGVPGWVGSFWTDKTIYYLLSWLELAHKKGFVIDYIGGWNERSWDADWYIKFGKQLKTRFPHTKLVAADDVKEPWMVAREMLVNSELRDVIGVVGVHSACGWRSECKKCSSPAELRGLPASFWNSEHSAMTHNWGAMSHARAMNRLYIQAKIVGNLCWTLVSAWYSSLPLADTGILLAEWPWSGYYEVGKSVWVYAHTTQFSEVGWQYLDNASGFLPNFASFVTRKSPDNTKFSTVVETCDANNDITADFSLAGIAADKIYVWKTNLVSNDDKDHFILSETIVPVDGKYSVTFSPGCIYTVTNMTGQGKGTGKPSAKIDDMMTLPYSENFESYGEKKLARFFLDLNGGFETAKAAGGRSGMAYRQMIKQKPVYWTSTVDPTSIFGDPRWWGDYEVSSDVLFEEAGYVELLGRISVHWGAYIVGYHLRLDSNGNWELYSQEDKRLAGNDNTRRTLASGKVTVNINQWTQMGLRMTGNQIAVVLGGNVVGTATDGTHISGQAGILASQWINAQFDNVSIVKTANWPVYVPVADMKVADFTSEQRLFHKGYSYLAENAIDGRPETAWYCEWDNRVNLPQSVTIDLGSIRPVSGLVYQPRRDTPNILDNTNGYTTKCKVYTSVDNNNFTEVAQSEIRVTHASRLITWDKANVRYVKFEVIAGDNNEASIGELSIITE